MLVRTIATVKENRKESETVHTLVLDLKDNLDFKPGQYVMLNVLGSDKILKRAYSICSVPGKQMELCIKRVDDGPGSNFLCDLKMSEKIELMGPMGIFKLADPLENNLVFLASGTGVSPFRSMINYLLEDNFKGKILLFLGVRTVNEIIYKKEFEELEKKYPNFKFVPVVSREEWAGEKGHVQDVALNYIKDLENPGFYICGLNQMVTGSIELLKEKGFSNIHHEKYD